MIRFSVITDEVSQDLGAAIAFAKTYGLDGVEMRSVWDASIFDAKRSDVLRMRDMLEAEGLTACCLSLPFFKCDLDDAAARAEHLQKLETALEHARILGASYVRGFSFWDKGETPTPYDRIAEAFAPAVPLLEQAGVRMVLEFDPSVYAGTATKLAQLLTALDSPWLRAVWDGGNLLFRPDGETSAMGYALLKPWIVHVHMKDAVREGQDAKAVRIGDGQSDVKGQLQWLAADGYDGWISLETHYRLNRTIDEAQLRTPAGHAFSMDGLAASEESMERLMTYAKEVGIR